VTAGRRHLVCPYGCQPGRFELLGGAVFVDSKGSYLSHEDKVASFRCDSCGAVAMDLAAAAAAQVREQHAAPTDTLTCPACSSTLLLPDDHNAAAQLECPDCGTLFSLEEGRPHLMGEFTENVEETDPD
jgi:uncharacterized protein YbaR (Trm112 family)